jgi:pyruvate dehydrogenase E2 component (dihydrolipoamide acetyltransferase)
MDVLMPQLGETVAEGKITKWFVAPGTTVKPGDNLFEIETDKVSMEVPSITAGTLSEIRVQAGETALVGAVVAIIAGEGGVAVSTPAPAAKTPPPPPAPKAPPATFAAIPQQRAAQPSGPLDPFFEVRTPSRNFGPAKVGGTTVTPLARRLAGENGIDLSAMKGSGPHGRIVAADVEAAIAQGGGGRAAAVSSGMSSAQVKALYQGVEFEEVPLDGMRATIARRLVEAKQTIPHFYLVADVTMDALLKIREEANAGAPKDSYKLSVNDFVIKALALALQRVPDANVSWTEGGLLKHKHSDIGVAVALPGGLITPIIRNAESKSLSSISNEMRDLAARARARKLKPHEYQGGTSSVSNLGMYGIKDFTAVINPPQSTILAVGTGEERAVVRNGQLAVATIMSVTLSCDHRSVDGALGAELIVAFKRLIENPVMMVV